MAVKQPGKPENQPEEKIEIIPSEKPQQREEIVNLDAETGKPIEETPSPTHPSYSQEDVRKMEARWQYELRRQRQEMEAKFESLRQPAAPAEKLAKTEDFDPDLHEIAQVNYQKAIKIQAERVADQRFKALMAQKEQEDQAVRQAQIASAQLEKSKAWVLERTPSLNDEGSEDFKGFYTTYNRMIAEDPTLVRNPYAPRLVWNEWNEGAKSHSVTANLEAERLKRVAAGQSPQGKHTSPGKKTIQLTQEEIDLCNKSGLSPAQYAKMKDANLKEGVSA